METSAGYGEDELVTEKVYFSDDYVISRDNMTTDIPLDEEQLPAQLRMALLVVVSTIFVIGATGNLLSIFIFLSTRALRTAPNFLIVNLSISDLLLTTANGPVMITSVYYGSWPFGETVCEIYAFFGALAGFASIGSMAAISIDRYYVICHCFHALMNVSKSRTLIIMFLVWVYASIWSIPPFLGIGAYVEEGYGIGCTFDYVTRDLNTLIYTILIYLGGFVVPVFVIAVCYFHIFRTVDTHKKEIGKYSKESNTKPGNAGTSGSKRNQKPKGGSKFSRLMAHYQLAKVGVIATTVFCAAWGPYAVIALYGQFGPIEYPIGPIAQVIPVVFAKSSSIWNPFVYAVSHKRFRQSLSSTLRSAFSGMESRLSRTNTESQELPGSQRSRSSNGGRNSSISSQGNRAASARARRPVSKSLSVSSSQESEVSLPPQAPPPPPLPQTRKAPVGVRHSEPIVPKEETLSVIATGREKAAETPVSPKKIELDTISGNSLVRNVLYRKTWHPSGSKSSIIANEYV